MALTTALTTGLGVMGGFMSMGAKKAAYENQIAAQRAQMAAQAKQIIMDTGYQVAELQNQRASNWDNAVRMLEEYSRRGLAVKGAINAQVAQNAPMGGRSIDKILDAADSNYARGEHAIKENYITREQEIYNKSFNRWQYAKMQTKALADNAPVSQWSFADDFAGIIGIAGNVLGNLNADANFQTDKAIKLGSAAPVSYNFTDDLMSLFGVNNGVQI
ncbi:MAG: hypothetical protein EOM14_11055 [Clostridia bacterium]|nr:hypothetical protein [Clostridia bacterium]